MIWDFGDPGTTADVSIENDPTWTYADQGTYTIILILNPGAVCADTAEVVYALYPTPEPFFTLPDPSCGPLNTVLTAEGMTEEDATIAWYLGWGTPSFAITREVEVQFPTIGVQPITLTITEHGCTGAYDVDVVANPMPEAYFESEPDSPQPDGASVLFIDGSNGNGSTITSMIWTLDGNVQGEDGSFSWEDAAPGTHEIVLTVTTAEGCTDTYVMIYQIIPEDIVIPNVFSPNNDGGNDLFVIENVQYYQNDLHIYNRWGNKIYTTANYQNQWNGSGIPDGTYYYELKLADGRSYTGHLTVLR